MSKMDLHVTDDHPPMEQALASYCDYRLELHRLDNNQFYDSSEDAGEGAPHRAMTSPQATPNQAVATQAADATLGPVNQRESQDTMDHEYLDGIPALGKEAEISDIGQGPALPQSMHHPMQDPFFNDHHDPLQVNMAMYNDPNTSRIVSNFGAPDNQLYLQDAADIHEAVTEPHLRGYAMLKFEDTNFALRTYAVVIGRDLEAAAEERLTEEFEMRQQIDPNAIAPRRRWLVSMQGGCERWDREEDPDAIIAMPNPESCPLLRIHPPSNMGLQGYQGISRRHLKIYFNAKRDRWEAKVLGRNGVFLLDHNGVQEDMLEREKRFALVHGTRLQVGCVHFEFLLPDEDTGAFPDAESSYEDADSQHISLEFEPPAEGAPMTDTSDEGEQDELKDMAIQYESDNESDSDRDEDASEDMEAAGEVEAGEEDVDEDDVKGEDGVKDEDDRGEPEVIEPDPKVPKKRGPGRPPKNGVMSKREQQEAKKAAQQKAKKTVPESPSKIGKPRKNSGEATTPPDKKEKRKYTKRKPKEPGQEGGSGEDKPAKEKKEKKEKKSAKPPRSPRSPSPPMNEKDFTEEQMTKPAKNYVTLIHEALTTACRPLDLPKIYSAMEHKYPWFRFRAPTTGWQSSVRHNLSQHDAFTKVQKEGKGYLWTVVEGVSIEKEKKQRHLDTQEGGQYPPQQLYPLQAGQMMHPYGPGPYAHPPPGHYPQGAPPNPHYAPRPPHGPPPGHNGHHGPYPPPLIGQQKASYSSPYANPRPTTMPPSQQQATHQNPQSGPHSGYAPPTQYYPPRPQQSRPPQPPQSQSTPNAQVMQAIETFKNSLKSSLKAKNVEKAETIVESAANRVLGNSQCPVFPNPHEAKIMDALRAVISKIPGGMSMLAPQRTAQNMQGGNHAAPANKASTLAGPIARPLFIGPNGGVARPPVMTPGASRTNSGSPATMSPLQQPATISTSPAPPAPPAPQAPMTVSSAPPVKTESMSSPLSSSPVFVNGNGIKLESNCFTPLDTHPEQARVAPKPDSDLAKTDGLQLKPDSAQIAGTKRPLKNGEDPQNSKNRRISETGPTPLKVG